MALYALLAALGLLAASGVQKKRGDIKKFVLTTQFLDAVRNGRISAQKESFAPTRELAAIFSGASSSKLKRGFWVNLDKADDPKRQFIRVYSNPHGTIRENLTSFADYVAWRTMAPANEQPGAVKGARKRSARVAWLVDVIGPGATAELALEGLKEGGSIATGIAGTVGRGLGGDIAGMATGIAGTIAQLGSVIAKLSSDKAKKKRIARALIDEVLLAYFERIAMFNPHIRRADGTIDVSKRYKKNPKTWGDLFAPGNARPVVYIPTDIDKVIGG